MKNLWPDSFNINEINTPKQILEQQSKFLPKLTGDLVYAEVVESDDIFKMRPFSYVYYIRGKFLQNYSYRVLTVEHDVIIYPVYIDLDSDILKEFKSDKTSLVVQNEEEFLNILEKVLKSERVKQVISSIMNLSR